MTNEKQTVSLEEIIINGYRSCQGTVFQPHPNLSALIGINGVGKTNILNAIHLLSPPDVRFFAGLDSEDSQSNVKTSITAWFLVGGNKIGLRLTLVLSPASRSDNKVLDYNEEWNFASLTKSKKWVELPPFLLLSNKASGIFDERDFHFRRKLLISQGHHRKLTPPQKNTDESLVNDKRIIDAVRRVVQFRRRINYYSASQFTDPTRCPSNFELNGDKGLETGYRSTGSHLQYLFDLYSLRDKNPDLYNEYVEFVSRQRLGLISRLSWREIKLSSLTAEVRSKGAVKKVKQFKTLVIPRVQIGSSYLTFNQLSEGTFKTLAMIFYIMTDASSCLLIEEPEVCVHHGLLTRIISTINAYSGAKQIIFSTHSDLVLDNISQDNVFVVDMHKAITNVTSLSKWTGKKGLLALNEYLQESGTLGEYWKSGGLSS